MDSPINSRSTLAQHADRLRSRAEAICCLSEGIPTFHEACEDFHNYCRETGLCIDSPADLFSEPSAVGSEHEVWIWHDRVIKLTHPNFFGLRVVYRDGQNKCPPYEYFDRWHLHNELFGDDVEVLGVVNTLDGPRTAIIQQTIRGKNATEIEIAEFFKSTGWEKFYCYGEYAWFDASQSIVVSDTHPGNLIKTEDGAMTPIDFRIQRVEGAILDAVKSFVEKEKRERRDTSSINLRHI